jgi:co-chaperonin GroES (HSP10)
MSQDKTKPDITNLPFKPFFNRVLLKREMADEKSKGGIIVHLNADHTKRNAPCVATVLDVGATCDDPIKDLIGKRIMFSRFAGDWLKIPNSEEEYYICSDEDILGEVLYNH